MPELEIAYAITAPANNPQLKYNMGGVFNLTTYSYLSMVLKTSSAVPPSVVRLDLIDYNGNNNQDNLFKISSFTNDGEYHIYASPITTTSNFNLGAVKEMRLYINYGIFGTSGTSKIWLKEVSLLKENPITAIHLPDAPPTFKVYPNPAKEFIHLSAIAPVSKIEIFNSLGQIILTKTTDFEYINIRNFTTGTYTIVMTDRSKQIHISRFLKQ
jgi:hypothetical protein